MPKNTWFSTVALWDKVHCAQTLQDNTGKEEYKKRSLWEVIWSYQVMGTIAWQTAQRKILSLLLHWNKWRSRESHDQSDLQKIKKYVILQTLSFFTYTYFLTNIPKKQERLLQSVKWLCLTLYVLYLYKIMYKIWADLRKADHFACNLDFEIFVSTVSKCWHSRVIHDYIKD